MHFSAVVCALPSLADVRVAWRRAVARVLCDGRILWQRVHGPLSALVATLAQYSWNPLFVDMRLSPTHTLLNHLEVPSSVLVKTVLPTVQVSLWKKASKQYLGGGLDLGCPDPISYKLVKAWRRAGDARRAGCLECIMTGGFWFPPPLCGFRCVCCVPLVWFGACYATTHVVDLSVAPLVR